MDAFVSEVSFSLPHATIGFDRRVDASFDLDGFQEDARLVGVCEDGKSVAHPAINGGRGWWFLRVQQSSLFHRDEGFLLDVVFLGAHVLLVLKPVESWGAPRITEV